MSDREGYHWRRDSWQPSASQQRVLDALADGLTNPAIAAQLGLSPETVKWHISELLAETGHDDRKALARWWQSRKRCVPALAPILALMARPALAGLTVAAIGLAMGAIMIVAYRDKTAPPPPTSPALSSGTPAAGQVQAAAPGILQDAGPFVITSSGMVQAQNRAVMSVVNVSDGDIVQFPPEMRWEPVPGSVPNPEYFLTPAVSVAGTKLYVFVQAAGTGVRFARVDDRTFRTVGDGAVLIMALSRTLLTSGVDHRVAVDAAGHLYLDPNPIPGDTVAIYGSGEGLDVSRMQLVGRLPPARQTYPGGRFFNWCEDGHCGLSYLVGPLVAPMAGTVECRGGVDFNLDAGAYRLQFRDARTTITNPSWADADSVDCTPGRSVLAGETITESYAHYVVTAESDTGEQLSVVAAYDGTLYVGRLPVSTSCPPCRGN